jgi:signal transduction histidine kinase
MELLDDLAHFTNTDIRREVAKKLANSLMAEDLLIFIKDDELNVLLPGIGFPQSLPDGRLWKMFLNSYAESLFKGQVPYRDKMRPAVAVRGRDQSVAVLIGGTPAEREVSLLKKILAITAPLLKKEQLVLVAEGKAMHSSKLAEKAERLTATLDSIRNNLMEVLEENSSLLKLTKQQNEELAAANEELRVSNEEVMAGIEELNETNKRLLSINADLDNFIYTASHDLKSPILNIEGLINILAGRFRKNEPEDKSIIKIIDMISVSINRFKETIGGLTEVIKAEKEALGQEEILSIHEITNEVQSDLYISIAESEANISVDIDESIKIKFTKKYLKSIIYNLLSNAIKYRAPDRKPLVFVDLEEEEKFFVLQVKDNGIGMNVGDKSKVFGLFQRLHSHVEGTGIGLYIVKKVIENSGGRIEVESTIGEGSTFRVYFKKLY